MRTRLLLLVAAAFLFPRSAPAQATAQLPPAIVRGLAAFQGQGAEAGVRALTPSWSTPDEQEKQAQLIDAFKQLQDYAGAFVGYDVPRVFNVSQHFSKAYIVLLLERQAVFLVLTLYTPPGKEPLVMYFNMNSDPAKVFPATLLEPDGVASPP